MKLGIFTIVLDGMPFIRHHMNTFQQLPFAWVWSIAEGASMNGADTGWCKPQAARVSYDGTHEYLCELFKTDPRVLVASHDRWPNKTNMCNTAIGRPELEDCDILLQVDVDEFHSVGNISEIVRLFMMDSGLGVIRMPCRFFVGPDLVCEGEGCWSNRASEWVRAWRFKAGYTFTTHEPPSLWPRDSVGRILNRKQSRHAGLIFDHYAYATFKQIAYKEAFYGYNGLVDQWLALQRHENFPVQLNQFFPWVEPIVMVKKLDPSEVPVILRSCLSSG